MVRRLMPALLPLAAVLWLVAPPAVRTMEPPNTLRATVLSIGDGDTLRVRSEGRTLTIRLACIDAPELAQRPWGQQSRAYLWQRLPPGVPVLLAIKAIDRYGRIVAEVFHEANINLAMVEDGQAFPYPRYLHQCEAGEYRDAEFRASRHRFGVWQEPGGITRPWDFRHHSAHTR